MKYTHCYIRVSRCAEYHVLFAECEVNSVFGSIGPFNCGWNIMLSLQSTMSILYLAALDRLTVVEISCFPCRVRGEFCIWQRWSLNCGWNIMLSLQSARWILYLAALDRLTVVEIGNRKIVIKLWEWTQEKEWMTKQRLKTRQVIKIDKE